MPIHDYLNNNKIPLNVKLWDFGDDPFAESSDTGNNTGWGLNDNWRSLADAIISTHETYKFLVTEKTPSEIDSYYGTDAGIYTDELGIIRWINITEIYIPCDAADIHVEDGKLASQNYVQQYVQGLDWQESVLDYTSTPPTPPITAGDRYLVGTGATGDWSGHDDDIAVYTELATWDFYSPNQGWTVNVEDVNLNYTYNGSAWVGTGSMYNHNDLNGTQGGGTGEYYHLTEEEYTDLTSVGIEYLMYTTQDNIPIGSHAFGSSEYPWNKIWGEEIYTTSFLRIGSTGNYTELSQNVGYLDILNDIKVTGVIEVTSDILAPDGYLEIDFIHIKGESIKWPDISQPTIKPEIIGTSNYRSATYYPALELTGDIIPPANDIYYIGDQYHRWQFIYCNNAYFGGLSISTSGDLTIGASHLEEIVPFSGWEIWGITGDSSDNGALYLEHGLVLQDSANDYWVVTVNTSGQLITTKRTS